MTRTKRQGWKPSALVALMAVALAVPTAWSALSGSGNTEDIVQIDVSDNTLSTLQATASGSSASANPVTSGSEAFTLTNSGSNVDTFIRFDWGTTPYYGSSTSATSIAIRGTTYYIGDLLWFKQETVDSASSATTSEYFSPLVVKNAASVTTSTFTSAGNACTGWTGSADASFSAAAAGTITFDYHAASSQTNDATDTSDTFNYCLDVTNKWVYLGTTTDFGSTTLVKHYTTDSSGGSLDSYLYEFVNSGQSEGNNYCLLSVTGTGTSATPDLVQCMKLPYETGGSTTVKLFALWDPPAYFPSVNQGGSITYGVAGTQWNPYASATTNPA